MSEIVVDASVTLSWCFPDEQTTLSKAVLDRLRAGGTAILPAFWAAEVLNTLLIGEERGRISAEQTLAFLSDLRILGPLLDHASLDQVLGRVQTISRDRRITPYDALHIELAMRTACPLATLDQPQRKAAQALGVECL